MYNIWVIVIVILKGIFCCGEIQFNRERFFGLRNLNDLQNAQLNV